MNVTVSARENRPPAGYSDGGEIEFPCSACGKVLAAVHVTRPALPVTKSVRAACCYCGDFSWPVEVRGGFHPRGHQLPDEADPENCFPVTDLVALVDEPDGSLTITVLPSKGAKP